MMPVRVKKVGGKFRVVEPSGKVARSAAGTPVDGGGFRSREQAVRQVQAINLSMRRRKRRNKSRSR